MSALTMQASTMPVWLFCVDAAAPLTPLDSGVDEP
jgi:hypothetical protein